MGLLVYMLFLGLTVHQFEAHIPMGLYQWAEPNAPVIVKDGSQRLSKEASLQRLTSLRAVMAANNVDAYIIPTADAHNSEYISPTDARREWISGMTGSAGTAVVTSTDARLWTDGRYYTQFYLEVDVELWSLMRQGTDATLNDWLVTSLPANSVVAVDPTTYSRSSWNTLNSQLKNANITLVAIASNLVDEARNQTGDPAPRRSTNPLLPQPIQFTGRVASAKIADLKSQIRDRGATALVLTALDDVAYTLNLRGSDIPYNPVFFSYLIIRVDVNTNDVILFWSDGVLDNDVLQHLNSEGVTVRVQPYENTINYLRNMATSFPYGSRIWLPQDGSHAIYLAAEGVGNTVTISALSPVAIMKSIKNDVELQGFRNAHIKDGVAVVRFLRWIHEAVERGENVTEIQISDKLEDLRSEEQDFMGPSFTTIAGAGENGAIIHYKPSREGPQRVVRPDDILLVDSGAQFKDGTTDITRTRHMSGAPTDRQRLTFTRVLQGQILMGTAVFPERSTGNVLDTLARKALWDVGLNYDHGTGHGVGSFLNVHEGPSGIGTAQAANDPGIAVGMIMSNEPGYYEVGEYGIRHEDLVEVIRMDRNADHILADSMVGDFAGRGAVGFYTISLVPHQTACLDVQLLSDFEIKYINDYHSRVLSTIGDVLIERNLQEDYDWLEKECAPISRNGAILMTSSPLVAVFSFVILFY